MFGMQYIQIIADKLCKNILYYGTEGVLFIFYIYNIFFLG